MKELKDNKELFENKSVPKAVWTLALPTMLSMLVMVAYNLADTFFVGQTNDQAQVAAVSLVMPIFLMLMAFGNLFGIGGGAAISRFLGADRKDDVKHVSSFCFYGAIVAGVVVGGLALIFMPQIIPLTGATPNSYQYVEEYLTYLAMGAPFIVLSNAFGNIVRSDGSAKQAMFGMMLGTVVNIVLDPILILWLDMGVVGAAVATVIGNIASSVFYIALLCKKSSQLSLRLKDFTMKHRIATQVLAIGVPASLNNILMSVASIIFNVFLSQYGDAPIAAMGIAMKSNMLLIMMLMGLTMGAQPLIGYNYGAHNYDRMKKVIRYIMFVGVCIGGVLMAFYLTFSEQIVSAFINDAEVIAYGSQMVKVQATTSCILPIMFVTMTALQSMSRAKSSLILSVCRQGLVFIPSAFFANLLWGLDGLIWAQPIADTFSVILSLVLLIAVFKKLNNRNSGDAVEIIK